MNGCQHWSQLEWLHQTVKNPNIFVKGTHSYYSGFYNGNFEDTVVRYLYGDAYSTDPKTGWQPLWEIDQLHIGDFVQIAPGVKIIMGGNNTHNTQFLSTYPFLEKEALIRSYQAAGDTVIGNDVWLGMCAMIMPGVKIGNGAIVAAHSVVTRDVAPYTLVGGNPAKEIKKRFTDEEIVILQEVKWWDWSEEKIKKLLPVIQSSQVARLPVVSAEYDKKIL